MEALQRETDDLLGEPPTLSKTRGLGRLRQPDNRAGVKGVAARPPITALAEGLLNGVEKELARRLRVLLQRIDVPSRQEIERLAERVTLLEARLRDAAPRDRQEGRSEPRSGRRIAKS